MNLRETTKALKINPTFAAIVENKLTWIISFALITAVAAQIAVPVKPVPFTLQAMMVLLSGAFLGARNGAYSQMLYLALGAIGLPVFAQVPDGAIGAARLIGPTGGYLLAFPLAAFLTGYIIEKKSNYFVTVSAMFLGYSVILVSGISFLNAFYIKDIKTAFLAGGAIFSVWTVAKIFAASLIFKSIKK
jgi:biotin transport system substrate-specific component